jgi:hypothetical protein
MVSDKTKDRFVVRFGFYFNNPSMHSCKTMTTAVRMIATQSSVINLLRFVSVAHWPYVFACTGSLPLNPDPSDELTSRHGQEIGLHALIW